MVFCGEREMIVWSWKLERKLRGTSKFLASHWLLLPIEKNHAVHIFKNHSVDSNYNLLIEHVVFTGQFRHRDTLSHSRGAEEFNYPLVHFVR